RLPRLLRLRRLRRLLRDGDLPARQDRGLQPGRLRRLLRLRRLRPRLRAGLLNADHDRRSMFTPPGDTSRAAPPARGCLFRDALQPALSAGLRRAIRTTPYPPAPSTIHTGRPPTAVPTSQPAERARLVVPRSQAPEISRATRAPNEGVSSTGGRATVWS